MKTEAYGGEGGGYEDRSVVPSDDTILHSDEDAESGNDDDEGHQDAGYPHQNGTGVVFGREVIDVHHGDCDRGVVRHECRRIMLSCYCGCCGCDVGLKVIVPLTSYIRFRRQGTSDVTGLETTCL